VEKLVAAFDSKDSDDDRSDLPDGAQRVLIDSDLPYHIAVFSAPGYFLLQ
jgi:hypothetical protein